jgi:hypothetical protein
VHAMFGVIAAALLMSLVLIAGAGLRAPAR